MTIRVLIVDDEPLARRGIIIRLAEHSDMEVIGECGSGEEAIRSIAEMKPDLVFMDVQMPGLNGIDVLRSIPHSLVRAVVFLTAYDEHALEAFEVHAIDYLLKPINELRLSAALDQVRRILKLEQQADLCNRMEKLLDFYDRRGNSEQPIQQLVVRSGAQVMFIEADQIDWIEAVGDYAGIHVGPKLHLLRETLNSLESRLDKTRFIRIHRSSIVQLNRIVRIDPMTNRDSCLTLRDGSSLRVSRTYSRLLYDALRNRVV
jgi:two-component system LytT family response regulator